MVPALVDELLEEILFRLAAEDPARLVHAALVCKRWRRLVSGHGFHRRFHAFRRTPAMLGVLCNVDVVESSSISLSKPTIRFVPTVTWFRRPCALREDWAAIDARHGRVLLHKPVYTRRSFVASHHDFEVWDPITDERTEVPRLPAQSLCWNAAVLCGAASAGGSCDHNDCHRGSFTIVFVGSTEDDDQNFVRLY